MNTHDAIAALKDALRIEIRSEVRAEVRAELMREINVEDVKLGKRLLTKRQVWMKLGISEDTLDELRRMDPTFPKHKTILRRLQWREWEVDAWMDLN